MLAWYSIIQIFSLDNQFKLYYNVRFFLLWALPLGCPNCIPGYRKNRLKILLGRLFSGGQKSHRWCNCWFLYTDHPFHGTIGVSTEVCLYQMVYRVCLGDLSAIPCSYCRIFIGPGILKGWLTTITHFFAKRFDVTTKTILQGLFLTGYVVVLLRYSISGSVAISGMFNVPELLGVSDTTAL